MRSSTEHLKQQSVARPSHAVGPVRVASSLSSLTYRGSVHRDAPMGNRQGVCVRLIEIWPRCPGTSEGAHGLAAATS